MFPDLSSNWTQCAMYRCGLTSNQTINAFYDPVNCMNIACVELVQQLNTTLNAAVAFSNGDYSAIPSYLIPGESSGGGGTGGGGGSGGDGTTFIHSGSNSTVHASDAARVSPSLLVLPVYYLIGIFYHLL